MAQFLVSQEKINCVTAGLFALGIALMVIFRFTDPESSLWAGIAWVTGIVFIIRQLLNNRLFDVFMVLIVFGGSGLAIYLHTQVDKVVPLLFFIGAIYAIFSQIAYYVTRRRADELRSYESRAPSQEPQSPPTKEIVEKDEVVEPQDDEWWR